MVSNLRFSTMRRARGQGMTEYIIIVALIAIASIGIITLFGDSVRALFGMSADSLAGDSNISQRAVGSNGGAGQEKTMKDFAQNDAYGSSSASPP